MKSIYIVISLFFCSFAVKAQSTASVDGKWIPEGFSNVLYILEDGKRYTYYCGGNQNCDSLYNTYEAADGNHIPGVDDFTLNNDTISIDLNFGNFLTSHLTFECDSNVLNFASNNTTWVRLGTNLNDCLFNSLEESSNSLSVFPNPASEYIQISTMDKHSGRLAIYNYTGQIVYIAPFHNQTSIPTTEFETGLYFIELTTSLTTHYRKILIR
jgi:hypothetical protein